MLKLLFLFVLWHQPSLTAIRKWIKEKKARATGRISQVCPAALPLESFTILSKLKNPDKQNSNHKTYYEHSLIALPQERLLKNVI